MKYSYYSSMLGIIEIGYKNNTVYSLKLRDIRFDKENNDFSDSVYAQIEEYLLGRRTKFTFSIHLEGTDFQIKVWNALLEIPYGQTRSYQDIARMIHNEKACRAVGNANNKNPIMIVVPCHRVINHNGSIGGFARDISIKERLLEIENKHQ